MYSFSIALTPGICHGRSLPQRPPPPAAAATASSLSLLVYIYYLNETQNFLYPLQCVPPFLALTGCPTLFSALFSLRQCSWVQAYR